MEYYISPAKPIDSEDYGITAKHPKAIVALRRTFPQAKWDILTATIGAQIPEEAKQNPT